MSNVDFFTPHRPRTVLEQLREKTFTTDKDFLIWIDEDVKLLPESEKILFDPNLEFKSKYDIERFIWKNDKGHEGYGIGIYRVRAIRPIFVKFPILPSAGLDIILQTLVSTGKSKNIFYTHPLKGNNYFRWGKGRAFCLRITGFKKQNLPRSKIQIKNPSIYVSYLLGFTYGLFAKINDESW